MLKIFRLFAAGLLILAASRPAAAQESYFLFESGPVRPLAMSPDGARLFAANTPDGTLEIFDIDAGGITKTSSVRVGMEPVAVAARTDGEVWVVNHLSDSVSIVDVTGTPRVVRTLLVGDEPNDIVFAGAGGNRAFIATAHRGQNSPTPRGEFDVPGIGRADVWVFDALDPGASMGGDPETIVTLFGDKPRALAVSPDGATVYAAVFHSGNQTTAIHETLVCDTTPANIASDTVQTSCDVLGNSMPGGSPPPHKSHDGTTRPETGLILKLNRDGVSPNTWQDELGRNWNDAVKFNLPDEDVFRIDADANPPVASEALAGVGTTLFNMVANPVTGVVYVSNTDAQNHVRFEGPGTHATGIKPAGEPSTVRGRLAEARITVIDGSTVTPRTLNKHIDYGAVPIPAGVKDDSLATPLQMAVTPDGTTLYVAAFGSSKIGVFDTAELENDGFTPDSDAHIELTGGGPAGIVLDGDRLYALTRFNNSVAVVDLALGFVGIEVQSVSLHSPEPQSVIDGRPFLYDARATGSNGEASCASCHIFADMDQLAWDLGNPDGEVTENNNPFFVGNAEPFHPMKGPMMTQSLRGLIDAGPQHWRGDRQGDANAAFNAFNVAFPGLVGRDEGEFSGEDMQRFTDFALQLRYPPNPIRTLDNSLRPDEFVGNDLFFTSVANTLGTCNGCHSVRPTKGFFGTDGRTAETGQTQETKIPHLRNMYQKVGMFGMQKTPGMGGAPSTFDFMGDQVRGFGFQHDGAIDTVERFVSTDFFNFTDPDAEENLDAFLMAFDSDLPPMVGQQVTRTSGNGAAVDARIDAMITAASTPYPSKILGPDSMQCDVVVAVVLAGEAASGLLVGGSVQFDDGTAPVAESTVRTFSQTAGQETTYSCVPFGSGVRIGLDRDEDGDFNRIDNCPEVFNPNQVDSNSNGTGDACEAGFGPTTTMSTTTTSTTTTTLPVHGPFALRQVKVSRLNKPAGEQKITLKSDEIDATGIFFDPPSEDFTVQLKIAGDVLVEATIPAGDPDWRSNSSATRFKWRAKTAAHPSGLHSVKISGSGEPFKMTAKFKNADGAAASGATVFFATLTVGTDPWAGLTPPCSLSGSGNTLNCR